MESVIQLRSRSEPPVQIVKMASSLTERLVHGLQSDSIPSLPINENEAHLREELRRSLLMVLRKRKADLTPDQWAGIWVALSQLFEGFEDEVGILRSEDLYNVIAAVCGSLSDLRIRESFTIIFSSIGLEQRIEIFRFGNAFRDGVAILAELILDANVTSRDRCCEIVISSLLGRVQKMTNATGAVDQLCRILMKEYLKRSVDLLRQLETLVVSVLFHGSMKKQYYHYLEAHGENICIGGCKEVLSSSCPSVAVFFGVLEDLKDEPAVSGHLPGLVKEFINRIPCSKEDKGVNSHFLFLAKMLGLVLESNTESRMDTVLDCLRILQSEKLYQPTRDQQKRQLTFLESLTQTVFSKSQPERKKRRLENSVATKFHLEFCQLMLQIEHRVLLPFLDQIMILLRNNVCFEGLLKSSIEIFSSVRQLMPILVSMAKFLDSRKILSTSIIDQITSAVRKLTGLEVLELIRSFLEISITESNTVLFCAILSGVEVSEFISQDLSEALRQLSPTLDALQIHRMEEQEESYTEVLELSLLIHQKLQKCAQMNPAVQELSLEVEKLPGISHRVYIELLLLRLEHLYQQNLNSDQNLDKNSIFQQGQEVVCCLERLVPMLDIDLRSKVELELMNGAFIPWIWFTEDQKLVLFFNRMLQKNPLQIQNLFGNPVIYGMTKFQDCFSLAYFTELFRLAPTDFMKTLFLRDVSCKQKTKTVRQILSQKLQNKSRTAVLANSGNPALLQWIKFGLQLPTAYFKKDRILLELAVVLYSTLDESLDASVLLECLSLFSLDSIYPHKHLGYLRPTLFQILQYCKSCFLSCPSIEVLQQAEAALFAVFKQFLYQHWSSKDSAFLNPDPVVSREPWKKQKITLLEILQVLMKLKDNSVQEMSFSVASMSVFVRLCVWFCLQRQHKGLKCFSGSVPISWSAEFFQKLKCKNSAPDLEALMSILRTTVLPWVKSILQTKTELHQLDLNLLSGLISDLISLLCGTPDPDLELLVQLMLTRIQSAAKQGRLGIQGADRISCLLFSASVVSKIDAEGKVALGIVDLHLSVLKSLVSELNSTSNDSTKILLSSLALFLKKLQDRDLERIGEYLIWSLRSSGCLEGKSSTLQCLGVYLERTEEKQNFDEILQELYTAFWNDYLHHVLLTLVDRKNRKSVVMPEAEQDSLFSSILSGFYHCFSICHNRAESLPQDLTIRIMKRTKRLIEGLKNRTQFLDSIVWFCEVCDFLRQALKQQRSKVAAKEISAPLKSAIQTLLQILIIWQMTPTQTEDTVRLAEVRLSMVFSEIASLPHFQDTIPHVLVVYFKVLESLKTKKFSRGSLFLKHFKDDDNEGELDGKLLRLRSKISVIISKLNMTQKNKLTKRVGKSEFMSREMQSLVEINKQFSGFNA